MDNHSDGGDHDEFARKIGGHRADFCSRLDEFGAKIGGHRVNSSDRAEPVDNSEGQQPSGAQAHVRANSTETFANLTHLPHLPHLSKSSSGYEDHPTSSSSTRAPATVDGSTRPIEARRDVRPLDAIRADLEHPHTAALLAVRAESVGDAPIGRLLRDVGPLVERLAAVERERDQTKHKAEDFEGRYETSHASRMWAEECFRRAEDERDAALARLAAQKAARIKERRELAAVLARIAAVEADATYDDVYTELSLALGTDDSADEDVDFKRDLTAKILRHFRAALAASPTPTGPETTTEIEYAVETRRAGRDILPTYRHFGQNLQRAQQFTSYAFGAPERVMQRTVGPWSEVPATPTEPTEETPHAH